MIPIEIERLWSEYVAAEKVRIRQNSLALLNDFIAALLAIPAADWHPWARSFAIRVVGGSDECVIRLPLFREVIFPALLAGIERSEPNSARCLAGLTNLLHKSPECAERLPAELRFEWGLLLRAVQDDPGDRRAKQQLLRLMRSYFDYALHELPSGILHDGNFASMEGCDALLKELADYERLANELGLDEEDSELISEARFHIPAYRLYLSAGGMHADYETFLSTFEGR